MHLCGVMMSVRDRDAWPETWYLESSHTVQAQSPAEFVRVGRLVATVVRSRSTQRREFSGG